MSFEEEERSFSRTDTMIAGVDNYKEEEVDKAVHCVDEVLALLLVEVEDSEDDSYHRRHRPIVVDASATRCPGILLGFLIAVLSFIAMVPLASMVSDTKTDGTSRAKGLSFLGNEEGVLCKSKPSERPYDGWRREALLGGTAGEAPVWSVAHEPDILCHILGGVYIGSEGKCVWVQEEPRPPYDAGWHCHLHGRLENSVGWTGDLLRLDSHRTWLALLRLVTRHRQRSQTSIIWNENLFTVNGRAVANETVELREGWARRFPLPLYLPRNTEANFDLNEADGELCLQIAMAALRSRLDRPTAPAELHVRPCWRPAPALCQFQRRAQGDGLLDRVRKQNRDAMELPDRDYDSDAFLNDTEQWRNSSDFSTAPIPVLSAEEKCGALFGSLWLADESRCVWVADLPAHDRPNSCHDFLASAGEWASERHWVNGTRRRRLGFPKDVSVADGAVRGAKATFDSHLIAQHLQASRVSIFLRIAGGAPPDETFVASLPSGYAYRDRASSWSHFDGQDQSHRASGTTSRSDWSS